MHRTIIAALRNARQQLNDLPSWLKVVLWVQPILSSATLLLLGLALHQGGLQAEMITRFPMQLQDITGAQQDQLRQMIAEMFAAGRGGTKLFAFAILSIAISGMLSIFFTTPATSRQLRQEQEHADRDAAAPL